MFWCRSVLNTASQPLRVGEANGVLRQFASILRMLRHPRADAFADQFVAREVGVVVVRPGPLLRRQAHADQMAQQRGDIWSRRPLGAAHRHGAQLRRHLVQLCLKFLRKLRQDVQHLLDLPELLLLVTLPAPHTLQQVRARPDRWRRRSSTAAAAHPGWRRRSTDRATSPAHRPDRRVPSYRPARWRTAPGAGRSPWSVSSVSSACSSWGRSVGVGGEPRQAVHQQRVKAAGIQQAKRERLVRRRRRRTPSGSSTGCSRR